MSNTEFPPFDAPHPPAPTVTVATLPLHIIYPVAVNNHPAPHPPPHPPVPPYPPHPPPATTRYSTIPVPVRARKALLPTVAKV